ncbi:MAG: glycine cleavage system aminomethyltransferase GcvT [Planctomycetia bacterium]|nr:glycine cleavage system aminomethyltransferase GcvT [Planctomycetia bacterium]
MQKFTSLYDTHVALNGKMVDFAGFMLPIQYAEGILAEHKAVRTAAGLFDVSHMGEVLLEGAGVLETLQRLFSNEMAGMVDGQARYTLMCNETGGVVDDVLVYRFSDTKYMVVVNAANCEKDVQWIGSHLGKDTQMTDISSRVAQIALQGPAAEAIIAKLFAQENIPQKNYTFVPDLELSGMKCLLSRTGYTGEDGFEIYSASEDMPKIWDLVYKTGAAYGLKPAGLGARDTLRLEASMPLYGHELGETIPANEVALNYFIKFTKDFIGSDALQAHLPEYKRVGVRLTDRGIAREGADVYADGKKIGVVTSGTHSPTLGVSIAMLRILKDFEGQTVEIEVRGRRLKAEVVKMPFYKRAK